MRNSRVIFRFISSAALCLAALSAPAAEFQLRVVDQQGHPIEGAVAWIDAPNAPSLAPRQMEIVQRDRQFIPLVSVIPIGSTVAFPNRDNVQHHVYSFSPARKFDIPLYIGESPDSIRFDEPGLVTLGCNIHDWMVAYVLVLDRAWHAFSNADGLTKIDARTSGTPRVHVWHPRLRGQPVEIEVPPGAVTEVKLRLKPVFRRTPPAVEGESYR